MTQLQLFEESEPPKRGNNLLPLDRFQGAILFSTIGDALGWPTEFIDPNINRRPSFEIPLQDFVSWQKIVGGKWWGYEEKIAPGEYSDDTQLALAVARCITDKGDFEPERFAYEELPLWLQYERGGGRSVKTAARKLIGKNASWLRNFYKQNDLNYRSAGANGAAMRNLPISLVSVRNKSRLIRDSFLNAIITHGHPRAIIGAILFGLAVSYAMTTPTGITPGSFVEYLRGEIKQIGKDLIEDEHITTWIRLWEKDAHGENLSFKRLFNQTQQEASQYLDGILQYINSDPKTYYAFVGALNPTTKGSGLGTVCVAIYLSLKYLDQPEDALTTTVNMFGSDTDTIGVFLGGLLGSYHGMRAVPTHLLNKVQDRGYLLKTAERLHSIATGKQREQLAENRKVEREEAYFRILAWEIGLNDMFWDALAKGGVVVHPTIGRGTIVHKVQKHIKREGYVAKLISIQFDCGQSCVFHSRVEHNERVSESLAQDIVNALK